jgi:hypothetical protein
MESAKARGQGHEEEMSAMSQAATARNKLVRHALTAVGLRLNESID